MTSSERLVWNLTNSACDGDGKDGRILKRAWIIAGNDSGARKEEWY
jgi:hypothetical protein